MIEHVKTIYQTYIIDADLDRVWSAFVDPDQIDKWGAGPAKMSATEGEKFQLWGGEIQGKNLKVINKQKIVQQWYEQDWEKPSRVTFLFLEEGGKTKIELTHENVPDSKVDDILYGWKRYYLGEIKKYLEA